jgi:hypothetical protein
VCWQADGKRAGRRSACLRPAPRPTAPDGEHADECGFLAATALWQSRWSRACPFIGRSTIQRLEGDRSRTEPRDTVRAPCRSSEEWSALGPGRGEPRSTTGREIRPRGGAPQGDQARRSSIRSSCRQASLKSLRGSGTSEHGLPQLLRRQVGSDVAFDDPDEGGRRRVPDQARPVAHLLAAIRAAIAAIAPCRKSAASWRDSASGTPGSGRASAK